MIELERHLEILLLSYECVIVPGLGGFMAHHVESRYDERDGVFLPPLRTLGFNPQLKFNDSLLAQSYVEAYDISYPEAVQRIEAEVDELMQHLRNEGVFELVGIGVLSLSDEGRYLFEPCEAGVLTPSLYGLDAFELRPCVDRSVQCNVRPVGVVPEHDSPVLSSAIGPVDGSGSQNGHALDTTSEQNVIKIKVAWLRNAIAIAVAVIAFFAVSPPISNSQHGGLQMGGLHHGALLSHIVQPTQTDETIMSAQESTSPSIEGEPEVSVAPEPAPEPRPYCLVLASRVSMSGAEALVAKLHAAGHNDAAIYVKAGVVRVTYGSFATEAEAYAALRPLRGESDFQQAWVYKKP